MKNSFFDAKSFNICKKIVSKQKNRKSAEKIVSKQKK
jgi:hypothetical protein